MHDQRKYGGNLFAHELAAILTAHGQQLTQPDPRLGISAAKARRLQMSLQEPDSLPVLSPAELEQLEMELPLSNTEWARLRAALLATAIERLLMDRIGQDKAAQAAGQVLSLIDEALQEQLQSTGEPGTKRVPDGEASEHSEPDLTWQAIYHAMDAATLALQMSAYVSSYTERVKRLREAQTDFQEALDELHNLDDSIQALPLWRDSVEEAQQGLDVTVERLEDLGEL